MLGMKATRAGRREEAAGSLLQDTVTLRQLPPDNNHRRWWNGCLESCGIRGILVLTAVSRRSKLFLFLSGFCKKKINKYITVRNTHSKGRSLSVERESKKHELV